MSKLEVGVVGVGDMGKRHAENIRSLVPHAQLVAIADPNTARAKRIASDLEIAGCYRGIDELLEHGGRRLRSDCLAR